MMMMMMDPVGPVSQRPVLGVAVPVEMSDTQYCCYDLDLLMASSQA
jgi:hypothetical protein